MPVIFTFLTPEERPDDERGARRHLVPEAGLVTTGACSLALSPPRLPISGRSARSSRHAARETQVRTRRSRRAAAIRLLIVTRPACQARSGNWTTP
jgi:hypothetical protein